MNNITIDCKMAVANQNILYKKSGEDFHGHWRRRRETNNPWEWYQPKIFEKISKEIADQIKNSREGKKELDRARKELDRARLEHWRHEMSKEIESVNFHDFQEWLQENNFPSEYVDIFEWDSMKRITEYCKIFEEVEQLISSPKKHQELFTARGGYMHLHGIIQWRNLNPETDNLHLIIRDLFDEKITQLSSAKFELVKKSQRLKLLAGIIDGSYPDYRYIIAEEKLLTRSKNRTLENGNPRNIFAFNSSPAIKKGPLQNSNWSMYPKLVQPPMKILPIPSIDKNCIRFLDGKIRANFDKL